MPLRGPDKVPQEPREGAVIRKRAGICSEPWMEDEFTEEGARLTGQPEQQLRDGELRRSVGVWADWAWNARS